MSLRVTVKNATDLPNFESIGKIDPLVVLKFRGLEKATKTIDDNLNPEWNEEFEWTLQSALDPSEILKIEVYDYERLRGNRLVGNFDYAVNQLWGKKEKAESIQLVPSKKAKGVKNWEKHRLNLVLAYTPLKQTGNLAGETGSKKDGSDEGGGEEGVIGDGDGGDWEVGTVSGGSGGKKRVRHPKLPDKPMDFQIIIHVLEGRKLEGNNISPIVKVSCGNEFHKTSSRKGTNRPVFDETLIFNFKERPVQLFDKNVEIKVMDTGKKIRDATIGVFNIDVGTIYLEPKHCFVHKWLLLTDAEDSSLGARGFLKVSLSVLGPEDDPVSSPSDISQDDVDIESNLLRPSGVRLQPATTTVRVYGGEDLPQMDPAFFEKFKSLLNIGSGQKELVDPFAVVSYAGHEERTEVKWNTQRPEWNQQINIGFRFPSMCERVRVQIKDKDKYNADDFIGTCFINISDVSAPGDHGFLPTFGPCYINMYGSLREFSELPDKYEELNKGLLQGVAYRGRVLLELETSLDGLPDQKKEVIGPSHLRKLQSFQRRHKYVLVAMLQAASMIQTGTDPVEFEVSIGNYGNKSEKSVMVQASSTQPLNPVYDGTAYHFLPWTHNKPCVVVESFWEDCSYRIGVMNILGNMADKLEDGINEARRLLRLPEKYRVLVPERVSLICEELLNDMIGCNMTMPKLPQDGYNKLDKYLRQYRTKEMGFLCDMVDGIAKSDSSTPEQRLDELEVVLERLKCLTNEPQNSIPDVIIWMLVKGKRVACCRIPSHSIMHSDQSATRGKICGKQTTIQLNPPSLNKESHLDGNKRSCLLQLVLWLGLDKDRDEVHKGLNGPGGELITYAETYENQAFYGIWGSGRKLTRPSWSDASGKHKLKKSYFEPPPYGWQWAKDWSIEDMSADNQQGEDLITIDVYEVQVREQFDRWPTSEKSFWTEETGTVLLSFNEEGNEYFMTREHIDKELPKGWKWINDWQIDINGSVAADGWEYSAVRYDKDEGFPADVEFAPFERNEHVSRRRRMFRTRRKMEDTSSKSEKKPELQGDGWMYARHANASYHANKQKLDFFRRRKWRRPLKCVIQGHPAVFRLIRDRDRSKSTASVESDSEDIQSDGEGGRLLAPHMYLTFDRNEYTTYQLRAYIYQARDLYGADKTGLSDPYCIVSCGNSSGLTRVVEATLSPKWSQTLMLENIRQYGSPQTVLSSPPLVAIELYDKDTIGQNEYIGMAKVKPIVRMTVDVEDPVLEWFPIMRYREPAGELLAAFELIRVGDGGWEPDKLTYHPDGHYDIPENIKPVTRKMRVETLCWGVRDMHRYQLLPVDHPMVLIEVGGEIKESGHIVNAKKNPMFPIPVVIVDVELPVESVYSPPLNIRVYDKRKFGYTPLVGQCTVTSLEKFEEETPEEGSTALKRNTTLLHLTKSETDKPEEIAINMDMIQDALAADEFDEKCKYDWWSKYYASIEENERVQEGYLTDCHDKLKVYSKELEKSFNDFSDLAQSFKLFRGKGQQQQQDDSSEIGCGVFKGSVRVYPVPKDANRKPKFLTTLPIKWPQEVSVRVYVIRGFDLQPRDIGGSSDPYIKVSVGKKEISDKENFIANQLNPLFGKVFEVDALLPFDRTLTVTVMDHDYLSADDIIGSTTIDLENRFLSLHRPLCGLSETFSKSGPNRWRDQMTPVEILDSLCKIRGFNKPEWEGTRKVTFNNHIYNLEDFETCLPHAHVGSEDQRLALHILKLQNIVPEHIEKRTLVNSVQPGVPQGYLHMWVDIYPKVPNVIIPPKVGIAPRKAENYVLRVIIWNTYDVILDERNPVSGDSMSDIYVKGWLTGSDDIQKTDIHYRSLDGEGNFNWRLVYPFEYIPQEQKMIVKTKKHFFSLDKTESRLPVRFNLQVWDNDLISADDFLGKVEFDLHQMPIPSKTKRRCRLRNLDDSGNHFKRMNLFEQKHVKGWMPVYQENYPNPRRRDQRGNRTLTGKVEVEFEILTEAEAKLRPAGKARDKPNQNPVLEDPDRPELSFAWFASPLKTFKFMIWRPHKCKLIFGIVLIFVIISFLLLF